MSFTGHCNDCLQDPPAIPEGGFMEIPFTVQGASFWTRRVELVERAGRGDLCFSTGLERRPSAGTGGLPAFVPCLQETASSFARGDANDDGGMDTDIADIAKILLSLLDGIPNECQSALDAGESGAVQLTNDLSSLTFLFRRGPPPPEPFPGCGADRTEDCDEVRLLRDESLDPSSRDACRPALPLPGGGPGGGAPSFSLPWKHDLRGTDPARFRDKHTSRSPDRRNVKRR